jgi:hypothetical protein
LSHFTRWFSYFLKWTLKRKVFNFNSTIYHFFSFMVYVLFLKKNLCLTQVYLDSVLSFPLEI